MVRKKQLGGILSGLIGNEDFLSQVNQLMSGFKSDPALSEHFNQSNTLFNKVSNQIGEEKSDQYRGLFDLLSILGAGFNFEEGGTVNSGGTEFGKKEVPAPKFYKKINSAINKNDPDAKLELAKIQFNSESAGDPRNPLGIIPGVKAEGYQMQDGGEIPVDPRGQFAYPNQPVAVPSPDGLINMDGVDQNILAMDEFGNQSILPANSGLHQFMPGLVFEIPVPVKKKSRRKSRNNKKKIEDNSKSKSIERDIRSSNDVIFERYRRDNRGRSIKPKRTRYV